MQVDLKPEELLRYQGSSPRPTDFDAYWDRALGEMEAVEPRVELVPAKFFCPGAECFDLWFTGVRGARIHAIYMRPAKRTAPTACAVLFHGYSGNVGDWNDKLGHIAAGRCFAALDCRGQGGLSEDTGGTLGRTYAGQIIRGLDDDTPDNLIFRHIFLDCAQLLRILMGFEEIDAGRIGVFGGSQGGGLTYAAAALVPEVKLACAVYPFLSDYKRVWEMDLDQGAYGELKDYFRYYDPFHEREDAIFTRLGYIDIQNLAPRIRAKLTMYTGLMDTTCPPSTQFAAYNKVTSEKNVVFAPDYGHEYIKDVNDRIFMAMNEL